LFGLFTQFRKKFQFLAESELNDIHKSSEPKFVVEYFCSALVWLMQQLLAHLKTVILDAKP